jgi:hypothetical protein
MYLPNKKNSLQIIDRSVVQTSLNSITPKENIRVSDFPKSKNKLAYGSNPIQSLFISVREKIGFYGLLIPEYNLPDERLHETLEQWQQLLAKNQIIVLFTEYPVDRRARYRFLSEVFFDMLLPVHPYDMQFCFVYDYTASLPLDGDHQQLAKAIVQSVLNDKRIDIIHHLSKRVRLNMFDNLSEPELYYVVNRYKQRCVNIINKSVSVLTKKAQGYRLVFYGNHETYCCFHDHCKIIKGNWQLEMLSQNGSWLVVDMQIEGIDF